MKVVCLNNLFSSKEISGLTKDKVYDAVMRYDTTLGSPKYRIIDDNGHERIYFISLDEWREKQLNKII